MSMKAKRQFYLQTIAEQCQREERELQKTRTF